jgi:hypothetical protein
VKKPFLFPKSKKKKTSRENVRVERDCGDCESRMELEKKRWK